MKQQILLPIIAIAGLQMAPALHLTANAENKGAADTSNAYTATPPTVTDKISPKGTQSAGNLTSSSLAEQSANTSSVVSAKDAVALEAPKTILPQTNSANSINSVKTARTVWVTIDQELADRLDQLLLSAVCRIPGNENLNQSLSKYNTKSQKSRAGLRDISLNYIGLPRGFDFSQEGAKLVLNQESKVKSLEAANYGKQRQLDELHHAIVLSVLQIAWGLGSKNGLDGEARTSAGINALAAIVGPTEAAKTVDLIADWSCSNRLASEVPKQKHWNLLEYEDKLNLVTKLALDNDPAMHSLQNQLYSYADHSKPYQITAKVVEGTVSGVTLLGPGIGIPIAAQAVGAMWGMANGGSEEAKLLKELYCEKQIESRRSAVRAEAQLVLMNYQQAIEGKNVPLLTVSESLLAQLVGAVGINQLLDFQTIDHQTFVNHPIQLGTTSNTTN